ncbi:hypothetical protein [Epilithonimonas sp.]|uniref:hypothetical protein n=1 Tax=Epilithonimonas sp. TaxID=2894511 RepID=UPI00289ABD1F|nr:hypothetical protein [Epilithonimonas sp.]
MKNLQLIGLFLVVAGSFLPLVHIPIVGNWNYWKVDNTLAMAVWGFSLLMLVFILIDKSKFVKIMAFLMILLFVFTIVAIKLKSLDYFSFLPFKSWQSTFAGIVKLSWGWFIEFLGVTLILIALRKNRIEPQRHKNLH